MKILKIASIVFTGVIIGLLVKEAVASRNSSGVYSLPAGNPVISGTTITSTWANTTLNDLGAEVTNSLDRNGRGSMLSPLKLPNGSAGAPSLTFTSEPTSGLYRAGTNDIRMQVGGTQLQGWTASSSSFPFQVNTLNGLTSTRSSANTTAITATGNGTGSGITTTGGATSGNGLTSTGGLPNGVGVNGFGQGTGVGVRGTGGGANGIGVQGIGTGVSPGGSFNGGSTSGNGGNFTGGPPNGNGISSLGDGIGAGISSTGGDSSGRGGSFFGGAPNGIGVAGQGTGTGAGGSFTGGATSGNGIVGFGGAPNGNGIGGQGDGTGFGVGGTGGDSSGNGGSFFGGTPNGIGVSGVGAGTGVGGNFTPGGGTTTAINSVGNISMTGAVPATSTGIGPKVLTAKNIIGFWAYISCTGGGTCTVTNGFNISSIALQVGNTQLLVNFSSPMTSSTSYVSFSNAGVLNGGLANCQNVTSSQIKCTLFDASVPAVSSFTSVTQTYYVFGVGY